MDRGGGLACRLASASACSPHCEPPPCLGLSSAGSSRRSALCPSWTARPVSFPPLQGSRRHCLSTRHAGQDRQRAPLHSEIIVEAAGALTSRLECFVNAASGTCGRQGAGVAARPQDAVAREAGARRLARVGTETSAQSIRLAGESTLSDL